jgi:hypothetical protein
MCVFHEEWTTIVEVVRVYSPVACFPIVLDIALSWTRWALVCRPQRLGVLVHEGGRGNMQVWIIVWLILRRCVDDVIVEKIDRLAKVHLLHMIEIVIYMALDMI